MTEPDRSEPTAARPETAGALLRAAREAQGLHIAALAAAIKVSPRKLEALEAGRYEELPDATFTRALAQTIARSLKIDPRPILEKLPAAGPQPLTPVDAGLNQPFREGGPRSVAPGSGESAFTGWRPMLWGGAALLIAAVALYFMPATLWTRDAGLPVPAASPAAPASSASGALSGSASDDPAASAPSSSALPASTAGLVSAVAAVVEAAASVPLIETVFSAPAATEPAAAEPGAPPAGVLVLRASEPSWVEVVDARGATLLSRTVMPGERLGLDGPLPLALVVGNVEATEAVFRGRPVDLQARSRDNVARLLLR